MCFCSAYFAKKLLKIGVISVSVASVSPAFASAADIHALNTKSTQKNQSQIVSLFYTQDQYKKLTKQDQQNISNIWGVTTSEYSKYLWLTHSSPSGKWYPQLNPAEVLGIDAKNAQERMHFAKIVVRNAHKRVSRELEFQRAYDAAQKLLYPNEQPIILPNIQNQRTAAILQSGDILLLFTSLHNSDTSHLINRLSGILAAHPAIKLNIYILGRDVSDSAIRTWAVNNHISAKLVSKNIISLNHDKGRFKKLTHGKHQLPLIVLDRSGKFKPIQISSIW